MILLTSGKMWVTSPGLMGELLDRGFGEKVDDKLLLAPEEGLYLSEKRKSMKIINEKNDPLSFDEIMKYYSRKDKLFPLKYLVYRDLRDRGYIVRTGFKFGAHYRVYPRGVKPGDGHSTWLVHIIEENHKTEFTEISRSVRLAQNVRKKMVFAVVDKEGDITYYKVERFTP